MTYGQILRDVRKSRNLTQVEVAKKTGIAQTSLSQIEGDRKLPSKTTLKKLLKVYKLPEIVLIWKATTEKDIEKNKRPLYRDLKPVIDSLVNELSKML